MADYDIGAAFSEIEDELISSMIRNLKRHQVEELTEGFEWTQWQALQIQALEDYKRKAAQKFGAKFSSINDKIDDMLTKTYNDSATAQEQQILRAIKKGLPQTMTANVGTGVIQGEFFKTNDRKLDALIKATKNDMQKAEYAVLRMTDDKYRKIIFNAQVYANTGAGTYAKAVDMATKDFLAAGINCIQYKNGRRVNIVSYAEMAIRTANKRAYLQGEGEMRKKWGIHTVILNQRVNACPKCSRFVGKVIIDDVWSGGTAKEAEKSGYLLMSDCIKQGLYHPNCKDSHTTYFGDILGDEDEEETNEQSEEEQASPDDNAQSTITETSQNEHIEQLESNGQITPQQQRINEQLYDAEQQQNYCEYQANKYDRLSKYSLDEDNQRRYSARKSEWKEKLAEVKESIQNFKKSITGKSAGNEKGLKNNLPRLVGTLDFNDESAIMETLNECEREALELPYERCRVVTSDGKIWEVDGLSGFVMTSIIETQENGSNLKGSYSYHNHPKLETYYSFSAEDVGDFFANGEIYAKASDFKYYYIMRRTSKTLSLSREQIEHEFKTIYKNDVLEKSLFGDLDIDRDGFHETMKILSKRYGFIYERHLRGGK